MKEDYSLLAIWGAVLSTILAGLKIWELWRARRRIEYSHNFRGPEELGNDVIIRNLSSTPIIVSHYELVWLKRRWFGLKKNEVRSIVPDSDFTEFQISPHSSQILTFTDEQHFDWSPDSLSGAAIYLRVHIAGERKPRLAWIYG